MPGAYVPPHLRNRSPASSTACASSSNSASSGGQSSRPRPASSDRSAGGPSQSRTPWSRTTPASSSREAASAAPWPTYDAQPMSRTGSAGGGPSVSRSSSGPGRARATAPPTSSSPSLFVFGDSFVGPMKLLSNDCARKTTYKGASAKGLNNPKSAKQVSKQLLPALEDLLAPPPYRYMPSGGRWALLIFGNVDLQINYLWQLQNKPLSHLSFETPTSASTSQSETETDEEDQTPGLSRTVLARATETSLTGPALGPELFVKAVAKAYISFLEREIVNGPIGERLRESAARRRAIQAGEATGKIPPPGKMLVAAALPPLVEDGILPRIPEKYVERLEEDHQKAQKLLDSTGTREWRDYQMKRDSSTEGIEAGVSTMGMTDRPVTPISGRSQSSQGTDIFDQTTSAPSLASSCSSVSSPSSAPQSKKTTIESLLLHDPPLCTLPVRISMTNTYNSLISAFCAQHPDVLSFIDISPQMHEIDAKSGWTLPTPASVDRGVWACPVDPTNVHPLWEPTLPLWLEAMKREGLPTEGYKVEEGEEETFRAYEEDKKRRTAARGEERERERAVKIREEE
ncbi:uncharacterized protein MKK02DRAFT_32519 [Dioszegia hungarica]|uniref:Uncharacterized protein n=1 Tax=Dioszegia hungarica TaxID=4972 RepID=A0AA38HC42_9TREE|nr:uncharacterized protein MKK02DRAFT_32519 [Dioszegia hungarica]KAI9637735.1 hypothetical protein MKK02DRAFT_32519 [Dioszegia hungarica]